MRERYEGMLNMRLKEMVHKFGNAEHAKIPASV